MRRDLWLRSQKQSTLSGTLNPGLTFRSWCLANLCLCLPTTSPAEDINTVAANANCDEVTIQQAERPRLNEDPEKVDWFVVSRKQREYAGRELLPEHAEKEPERDSITGCAIKNEGEANGTLSNDDQTEMTDIEQVGLADRASDSDAREPEETEGRENTPSKAQVEPEQSLLGKLNTLENSRMLPVLIIFTLTASWIGLAFGLNYLRKIAVGLMQRRRVCHIPCSLVTTLDHEVVGHMTVIGLRSFRFVPLNQGEMAHFKRTLDEPEMFYFSVLVGDLKFEVFVDGIRGYYSPVAFDVRLTPKMQKQILEFSTITPQIGQLIVVPYNIEKHKSHIKNRANNTVYMDQSNAKKTNQKSGHSAIRKALSNAGIGFGHST